MSKITFRADDDLVEQLEGLEASKSEAMREALRAYLESDGSARDGAGHTEPATAERDGAGAIDELVRERVDERLATRLRELGLERANPRPRERESDPQDVNITVSLEGAAARSDEQVRVDADHARKTSEENRQPARTRGQTDGQASEGDDRCTQCGEDLDGDHVYCPNCGEKASRRLFCDCGDEIRSDWSFCPSCGRRTPAADVLESESGQF